MSTITYEGTMPGSRIQGEVIERHADGSVTVVHPDGSPWRYTVRPEHIIVDEATPTAADASSFRTVLLRTALDLGDSTGAAPVFVDARFAGGAIQVERDAEYLGDGRAVVTLALPGHTVTLFPHEALALAAALTARAEAVTPVSAYPDTLAGALTCLADNAVPELVQAAERAVQQGTHAWMPDPAVPGVWGLALHGGYADTPRADVVVYCTDGDFTASDAFTMEAAR